MRRAAPFAVLAAATATTLLAALARVLGVTFQIPDGGQAIPLPGIAVVTAALAGVGVVLALVLRRWSARPVRRFRATTLTLTALSLIPPVLVGAAPATVATLIVLHLVAAAVVIPALTRALSARSPRAQAVRS